MFLSAPPAAEDAAVKSQPLPPLSDTILLKLRVRDWMHDRASGSLLPGLFWTAAAFFTVSRRRWLERLAEAYRHLVVAGRAAWIEPFIRKYVERPGTAIIWRDRHLGWRRTLDGPSIAKVQGLVLKPPRSNGERGVLIVHSERDWLKLLDAKHLDQLVRDFTLICVSSWSTRSFAAFWSLAHLPDSDVYLMPSHAGEPDWFGRLQSGIQVLPFLASHWLNPDDYDPWPLEARPIDIVMTASWSSTQRHWLLFEALRHMSPTRRFVLVGHPEDGRTKDDVWREARQFGLANRVEIFDQLKIAEELTTIQCASKTSVFLSAREGSGLAVAGSLLAGAPVAMTPSVHSDARAFLNPDTGTLLDARNLGRDLSCFLEEQNNYVPRTWALERVSCIASRVALNARLRIDAAIEGRPWANDISTPVLSHTLHHFDPGEAWAFADVYRRLEHDHNLNLTGGACLWRPGLQADG